MFKRFCRLAIVATVILAPAFASAQNARPYYRLWVDSSGVLRVTGPFRDGGNNRTALDAVQPQGDRVFEPFAPGGTQPGGERGVPGTGEESEADKQQKEREELQKMRAEIRAGALERAEKGLQTLNQKIDWLKFKPLGELVKEKQDAKGKEGEDDGGVDGTGGGVDGTGGGVDDTGGGVDGAGEGTA